MHCPAEHSTSQNFDGLTFPFTHEVVHTRTSININLNSSPRWVSTKRTRTRRLSKSLRRIRTCTSFELPTYLTYVVHRPRFHTVYFINLLSVAATPMFPACHFLEGHGEPCLRGDRWIRGTGSSLFSDERKMDSLTTSSSVSIFPLPLSIG